MFIIWSFDRFGKSKNGFVLRLKKGLIVKVVVRQGGKDHPNWLGGHLVVYHVCFVDGGSQTWDTYVRSQET